MTKALHMSGTRAAHSWRIAVVWTMVAAGLAMCQATAAGAASFTVNPTQVFLSGTTKTALITLKNETDQPVRFQISVMNWGQDPKGQMQLEPTEDVVFFPALLTLNGHEERKIRVGATVSPGAVEKTYRLFVEELPPLERRDAPAGVTMRTKMGIPIFLQPARAAALGQLKDVTLTDGRFSFHLLNAGTAHFTPEALRVRGVDTSGGVVFEQSIDTWYILAGGFRDFDIAVPGGRCADIRSLVVEAQLADRTLKETLQAPGGACAKRQ